MKGLSQRRSAHPVRFSLASSLGDEIDGAWWPYTNEVGGELPDLVDALRDALGQVVDIGVNWSSLDGGLDLDLMTRRGVSALPGIKQRRQRVMTLTGNKARASLLVVPSWTSQALAVMVMRHAAALPIHAKHLDTPAYEAACAIVTAARGECAQRSEVSADGGGPAT